MIKINFASDLLQTGELNSLISDLLPTDSSTFEVVQNKNVRSGVFQHFTEFLVVTIIAGSIVDLIKDYFKEFLKNKISKITGKKPDEINEVSFIHIIIYKQGDFTTIDSTEIDEDIEQKINEMRIDDIESIITTKK